MFMRVISSELAMKWSDIPNFAQADLETMVNPKVEKFELSNQLIALKHQVLTTNMSTENNGWRSQIRSVAP